MTALALLACAIWAWLLTRHGRFWQSGPMLAPARPDRAAAVCVVIPARDEAEMIAASLGSILAQDYAGPWRVILVDDASTDATGAIARGFASPRLTVLSGRPRPPGWAGKLWAVAQGIEAGIDMGLSAGIGIGPELLPGPPEPAEFVLLTDADIVHDPLHLATLVARAEAGDLDLVSEMVALACDSPAERALVPAFVYFFQLLYPFAWVNDPRRATAAAAGGSVLIRRRALERIGGIASMRGALIDDVALAASVKRGGRIWLGHSGLARSIRPYPHVADIWRMVARSAYVQLRCSPVLLVLSLLGMALVFLVPPAAALDGLAPSGSVPGGSARACLAGLAAWVAMAASFLPTLRRFGRHPAWAAALPAIAAFYMAATLGSAWNHWRGRGVAWKGRAYATSSTGAGPEMSDPEMGR